MTIPNSEIFSNAPIADIGAHVPKPTALTEGVTEATKEVWSNDRLNTGVWECTPGTFTAERNGFSEICYIISGRVTLETEGGDSKEYGPGDILINPSGWRGTWIIHETLRKHYTIVPD